MTTTNTPIVTIKNNAVVANSRDVAAYFGKEHFNVLQDIDALIKAAPEAELNFQVCSYKSVEGGRSYRAFDMTRDGFTLLAMGFTGKKALQFKLRYIAQFNAMEAEQRARELEGPASVDNLVSKRPGVATPVWSDKLRSIINLLNYHSLKERPRRGEDQIKGRRGGT